jgi:hypothetical protein
LTPIHPPSGRLFGPSTSLLHAAPSEDWASKWGSHEPQLCGVYFFIENSSSPLVTRGATLGHRPGLPCPGPAQPSRWLAERQINGGDREVRISILICWGGVVSMRLKGVWVSGGSTTDGEAPPQPRVIDGWAIDMKEAGGDNQIRDG